MRRMLQRWRARSGSVMGSTWPVASGVFLLSGVLSYGVIQGLQAPGSPAAERTGFSAPVASPPEASPYFEPLAKRAFISPPPEPRPEGFDPSSSRADPLGPRITTGRLEPGGTLGRALAAKGVSQTVVHRVATSMRPVFDFRRARVGDAFVLAESRDGGLLWFEYRRGRETIYRLDRGAAGEWVATRQLAPLARRDVTLAGVIGTSVFDSFTERGESPALVHAFADLFAWDVDFSRQVRSGDEFRLMFRKYYDSDGFVRYGKILAAEYRTSERAHTALYFEDEDGYADYFTPEGYSLRRAFLRAPLDYSRISSRYSKSRLHPILKIRRPHEGIDYAAPTGTPVWAVADGEVIFAGRNGGFGRLVKLRHPNGFVTYYGHLSRYGQGVRIGSRVRQKDVIGYVGSTGLSTGPHLDYRVKSNGRYVDPMKLKFPLGRPIPAVDRERFARVAGDQLGRLRALEPHAVPEASL